MESIMIDSVGQRCTQHLKPGIRIHRSVSCLRENQAFMRSPEEGFPPVDQEPAAPGLQVSDTEGEGLCFSVQGYPERMQGR